MDRWNTYQAEGQPVSNFLRTLIGRNHPTYSIQTVLLLGLRIS